MQRMKPEVLARGQQHYRATLNDDNRAVRDPIITAFGMAMTLDGYRPVLVPSGCTTLRPCPVCAVGRSSYSTLYEKDGARVWACPICETITDH